MSIATATLEFEHHWHHPERHIKWLSSSYYYLLFSAGFKKIYCPLVGAHVWPNIAEHIYSASAF